MNRRRFLSVAGKTAAGVTLAGGLARCSRSARRLNIIVITIDTLRGDHLGCYGYPLPTSPNIDRFATESMLFEDSYCSSSKTLPSHASILTGLHPYNHGVVSQLRSLHPEVTTIANLFGAQGFDTAAITSWSVLNAKTMGNGFDIFRSPAQHDITADKTTAVAVEFLKSARLSGKPFFMWIHYWDPHFPYAPADTYRDIFFKREVSDERLDFVRSLIPGAYMTLDPIGKRGVTEQMTEQDRQAMVSQYDGEIAYTDRSVGVLMDTLKNEGLYDNSVICLTADHGESLFENDSDWLAHATIYEPVVRVPLIMRHPDFAPARLKGLVQGIDIAPTLLAWQRMDSPHMDGKDMAPIITSGATVRDEVFLTEGDSRFVGMRKGNYKLRTLTARREKPVPIPQHWKHEVETLPRISLSPEPPSEWKYDAVDGAIVCSWTCPRELETRIHDYTVELLTEKMLGPDQVFTVERVDKDTRAVVLFEGMRRKRWWDAVSATLPSYLRVVGRDKDGRHIATSDIVPFVVDSPLGLATELYDLDVDPYERDNIAENNPTTVSDLKSKLGTFGENTLDAIINGPAILDGSSSAPKMDEENLRRLRTIGYAQ